MTKEIGKKLFCLIGLTILFGYPISATGQKLFAANDAQNILYLGIPNPITIAVDGTSCSSLQVFGARNLLKLEACKAIVMPSKKGVYLIEVFKSGKKLGEFPFRVIDLPKPVIRIGTLRNGNVRLNELIAFGGLMASVPTNQMDLEVSIINFNVYILKTDNSLIKFSNVGPKFSEELLQAFAKLDIGDKILFSSIEGLLGTEKVAIEPSEVTIIP